MTPEIIGPIALEIITECWPRRLPARITGYTRSVNEVVVVRLGSGGAVGWAEAIGVYYGDDDAAGMVRTLEAHRAAIEAGLSREKIQCLLSPGGARNALDCAFWDLEAKLTGVPAWQRAGLRKPRPLVTTLTCHADDPETMAARALEHEDVRAVKLKLTGDIVDADRVRMVRRAKPDVWLAIDANQGFTPALLDGLMPTLLKERVSLIEQPFPVGDEALLDGFKSPIPIAADESLQTLADVDSLIGRFDVANIKLDKCGGLTEGLQIANRLHEAGLRLMVGNMGGTSLAMAPAWLLGQLCEIVDLDGPTFLNDDRTPAARYADGRIDCPEELWGGVCLAPIAAHEDSEPETASRSVI